jgi:hypothetical protein
VPLETNTRLPFSAKTISQKRALFDADAILTTDVKSFLSLPLGPPWSANRLPFCSCRRLSKGDLLHDFKAGGSVPTRAIVTTPAVMLAWRPETGTIDMADVYCTHGIRCVAFVPHPYQTAMTTTLLS